jgi:hypothetical protein
MRCLNEWRRGGLRLPTNPFTPQLNILKEMVPCGSKAIKV